MRSMLSTVAYLPRNLAVVLLVGYRKLISPLYGDVCRYYPSCSAYGLGSVQQRGVLVGSGLTLWRILRCNPFARGGIDEVRTGRRGPLRITPFGFVVPGEGVPADHHATGHHHHTGTDLHEHPTSARLTDSPALSRKD
ncbi:membrane protein insertion efficiency factor YidD [Agromyces seonyuensis]|uniref:Putative membrane protein insertion efficiency factor n=1 Tax=Agromyces seonyuensis TaxID=2662446 RepID=A0A6I4NT95_9MICO|nr:membrane protein insertion efficiency factor YidD [Agromyces seonyuensis]MWB97443.1 membrane protein insertion efficiency factor YidD [Agromyces seonyuensis]